MVTKLNLSALANAKEIQETEIPEENNNENAQITEKKKGLIHLKKSAETIVHEEPLISNNSDTESFKKTKVSLRGLKKPEMKIQEDIQITESQTNDSTQNTTPIEKEVLLLENPQSIINTLSISDNIESSNDIVIQETSKNEEEKKEAVVAILDGDTNCAIVKDDSCEIFSSYKGSFLEIIEEEKPSILSDSQNTDTINIESENEVEKSDDENRVEDIVFDEQETVVIQSEETNQIETKLSPLQKLSKYKQSKKVWYSGIISVFLISILSFAFLQPNDAKINIIESAPITTKKIQTPIIKEKENIDISQTSTGKKHNNIENIEIVKVNNDNFIDNSQNNNRIDAKVQNFLLKKYKSK